MGLSASQARLLSITQRLSNNELQSEIMANNKIRLSEANVAARDKYIQSLDSTRMDYISYDDSGIQETVALTFNSLSQYTPLKNQYNLYNSKGQILVSPTDAKNFTNSKTLYEFLDCYGLFDRGAGEYQETLKEFQEKMDEFNKQQDEYNKKLAEFNKEFGDYQSKLDDYNKKLEQHMAAQKQYEEDMKAYEDALNAPKIYDQFSGIVGTSDAPQSCYSAALNNPLGQCYRHVLGYLIDPSTTGSDYLTSAGDSINVSSSDVSGSTLSGDGKGEQLTDVRNTMNEKDPKTGKYKHLCDKDDDLNTDGLQNILQSKINAGQTPTKLEILMSDYIYDSATNSATEVKSLHQKAVDMMYIIKNQSEFTDTLTADTMKNLLINFTDGDMKGLNPEEPTPPEPPEAFNEEMPVLNAAPPKAPEKPVYTQKMYDQPLAQWYINLWNAMEGSDKSDKISSIDDENANFSYYTVPDKERNSTFTANGQQLNKYYEIIDKNLASDSNWLQFALTNGLVTMKQAALRFNGDITWQGIEFSSTSDIREVEDSSKIAKAEAEYQKSMYEIQAQDKEYDVKIKKLDTEHSALQQEVESIKNVMGKNTERSFATFS